MAYPCWVDPTDTGTLNAIVFDPEFLCSGTSVPELTPDQTATAEDAISAATEILFRLTGGLIHGPGVAVDEYVMAGNVRKLSTTFKPVRDIISAERVLTSSSGERIVDLQTNWTIIGHSVYFGGRVNYATAFGPCSPLGAEHMRLTYRYGSTVTRGARSTLLYYARQLYLAGPCGDINLCQLPERVTSINREGVSLTTVDPQTFLDRGLTGLIRVDEWLASYAARKVLRASAVYSHDSPPPVNVATWCSDTVPTTYEPLGALQ